MGSKDKLSKHDTYVEELKAKLAKHYDDVHTNVIVTAKRRSKKRVVAEIDILARKGSHYDVYEVKCSHRIAKAKMQLKKIKKSIEHTHKVRKSFFYCGSSALLLQI